MKYKAIIFGLIILAIQTSAQDSTRVFLDEFNASVNCTTVKGDNNDRCGFGLGAYHSFMPEKMLNIIIGFEYNRTTRFNYYEYGGHFSNATDLTYRMNFVSVPLGLRINFGNKTKIFLEAGGFADLMVSSNKKGTYNTFLPDSNMHIVHHSGQIDEPAGLPSSFGVYAGLGIRIPVSTFELIIKPDYKFGLNEMESDGYVSFYNRYFRLNIGIKINRAIH